jgi:hypothetical protein
MADDVDERFNELAQVINVSLTLLRASPRWHFALF